jgi:exodeoxyribonuclease V gamma subunit
VLVAQLRDYLKAGWELDLEHITTEHALQPFSRRYFEQGGLLTYAGEWRAAHASQDEGGSDELPPYELEPDYRLKLAELATFLKQPARHFFRRRLGVVFAEPDVVGDDEEPFALDALERYFLEDSLLDDSAEPEPQGEVRQTLAARAERLAREGVLPIGLVGRQWQQQLVEGLVPVRSAWLTLGARFPTPAPKLAVSLEFDGIHLDDWIDRLRTGESGAAWLQQICPWLRQLAAAAAGASVSGYLVARDAIVTMAPLDAVAARSTLAGVVAQWRRNLDAPLAVACKSALAELQEGDARATYDGGFEVSGEVADLCLARLWPDFAALTAGDGWPAVAHELYGPLAEWLETAITIAKLEGEAA